MPSSGTNSNIKTTQHDNTALPMEPPDDPVEKIPRHNITEILKEIACSPVPHVDSQVIECFKRLKKESAYTRNKLLDILRKTGAVRDYNNEELEDLVEKLEASHGYTEHEIIQRLNHIQEEHGYSKSQMTKMLEKLSESDQYTILHYGALFNNVLFCRCIIETYNCTVDLIGWDGESPLHIAARVPDTKYPDQPTDSSILLYLLRQTKVNINIQDSQGRTPLHFAIMYNRISNVKYLLDHGVKRDIGDIQGAIPLHYVCRYHQNKNMIGLFFDSPELFSCKTKDNKRPIDVAAEYGNADFIKLFFESQNVRHVDDTTTIAVLLNAAVRHNESEVLSFIKGQYENMLHEHPNVLHLACHQLHGHKMISHLINPKTILYQDKQISFSPLMVAVQHRQLACVKELLQNKYFTQDAFELVSDISLRTVLHVCAEIKQNEITKVLFDSRFMSNSLAIAADILGDTPVHICAQVGNAYMTERLLGYISQRTSPVVAFSDSPTPRTMTNLDMNGRVPTKSSVSKSGHTTSHHGAVSGHVHAILMKRNKSKLSPLHVAIQAGHLHIIHEILKFSHQLLINECDDQQRTSLHMAAEKGHVKIIDILLQHGADVDACDINESTPLHDAARSSKNREDNKERVQCIERLAKHGSVNINALNIRRETPLHIACEYGSNILIEHLIKLGADLFATNVHGCNCLEVAIEKNNEEVVRYLIEHEYCFDLMPDTPMRKLIREMPQMALIMLDKCSMAMGTDETNVQQKIFLYEFLDDQYTADDWEDGNFGVKKRSNTKSTLYTTNIVDLVTNHPLFLMCTYETNELMAHPLSKYLVKQKFKDFGIYLFSLFIIFYIAYLALFTTIVLRTQHPQAYYNLTSFEFDNSLCSNVSQALVQASPSVGGIKTTADYALKYILYVLIWLHVGKNILIIIEALQISLIKTVPYWLEIAAVILSFVFTYDESYQKTLTFRCPHQWEYGACGLLISWLVLLQYVQFMPVIGLYVAMLSVIVKKFLKFMTVLLILISGFALTFYMVFQNFSAFKNPGFAYIRTALTIAAELGYEDRMFNETTEVYYKVAYFVYIMFWVIMTICVTNLLIGLAVGEIPPLMKQAADRLNQLFFQLVADCEIIRYQLNWILCRGHTNDAIAYSYRDLDKKTCINDRKIGY